MTLLNGESELGSKYTDGFLTSDEVISPAVGGVAHWLAVSTEPTAPALEVSSSIWSPATKVPLTTGGPKLPACQFECVTRSVSANIHRLWYAGWPRS